MKASIFVTSFDDVSGAFLDNEVRLRVFPKRGAPVDVDLTYDQADDVIFRMQKAMGMPTTDELCQEIMALRAAVANLQEICKQGGEQGLLEEMFEDAEVV